VFVPRTAPGDRVRLRVDPAQRPARGQLLALLEPGPDRVAPACPWSDRCGGCDWMHLSIEAQRRAHLERARQALPAAWAEVPVESRAAGPALAYRTRARVHVQCGAGRGRPGRVVVGMHEAGTHQPVEVEACAVLVEPLERARRHLGPLFEGSRGRGDVQMALGAGQRAVLEVRWTGGEVAAATFGRLEAAVGSGALAGARVWSEGAARPATVGDPTPWMTGPDGAPLRLAPGGFGQAHEEVNAALATHVAERARRAGPGPVVELYAGAGNLGVLLARDAPELVCVEASREACDAARANLTARGLRARVVEGAAERYEWAASTHLVVLDPPRTGAREVAERLARSRVRHVVYVACDAATLGRDLAALQGRYAPVSVTAFEMFPQTSHVEIVVTLERARS
jgi:23S rRNA (uracil1939-C5)-methyltransferase